MISWLLASLRMKCSVSLLHDSSLLAHIAYLVKMNEMKCRITSDQGTYIADILTVGTVIRSS